MPLTIPNLMAFLLARCQPELRWRLAISTCTSQCLHKNLSNLEKFRRLINIEIRALKLSIRLKSKKFSSYFRILLKRYFFQIRHVSFKKFRRCLQKRYSTHLKNILGLLYEAKFSGLTESLKTEVINDTLLLNWLLTNRFDLNYKKFKY